MKLHDKAGLSISKFEYWDALAYTPKRAPLGPHRDTAFASSRVWSPCAASEVMLPSPSLWAAILSVNLAPRATFSLFPGNQVGFRGKNEGCRPPPPPTPHQFRLVESSGETGHPSKVYFGLFTLMHSLMFAPKLSPPPSFEQMRV